MSGTGGLEKLTPAVIRFPIEKTIKAFVNLKLKRKTASSYVRIVALIAGLIMGYLFPQIGEIMAVLVGLASSLAISPVLLTSLTMLCSMVLTATVFIYVAKISFQYFYTKKYGYSNSEYRLTDNDKELLLVKFQHMGKQEQEEIFSTLEKSIVLICSDIQRFKLTQQMDFKKIAKDTLNRLKLGDLNAYDEYCKIVPGIQSSVPTRSKRVSGYKAYDDDLQDQYAHTKSPATQLYKRDKKKVSKPNVEEDSKLDTDYYDGASEKRSAFSR